VVRVGDAGDLTATVVDGVAVLAAGPVGASGRHAALAEVSGPSGIETWWLGLGATPVPPLPSPRASTPAPPPPGLEPTMARTWRRAGDLARAGATASALAAYEQLAAVAPPAAQAQALIEVLGLRRRRGEPLAASYESLSGRAPPGSAAELAALRAAVTAAVDEGEFTDAVRLIDRALASPALGVPERTTLQATRVGIAPATVALFDGDALDESWRIADPVGVRRDPGDPGPRPRRVRRRRPRHRRPRAQPRPDRAGRRGHRDPGRVGGRIDLHVAAPRGRRAAPHGAAARHRWRQPVPARRRAGPRPRGDRVTTWSAACRCARA
jgi:hypothetical protein